MTFTKYEDSGAYHWAWADRDSPSYEPAAEARYAVVTKRIAPGHRVLDVGCGDGYLMNHVREYRPEELASLLGGFFLDVQLSFFISRRWWEARRRLGKMFMRAWSKHVHNPFLREGRDANRFCHVLAVCAEPRRSRGTS